MKAFGKNIGTRPGQWKNLQENEPEQDESNMNILQKTLGQDRDSGNNCSKAYPNMAETMAKS